MNKIRLLLIEDNRLLRDGIAEMLKGHRDIKIVAASEKTDNSILKIHELKPNVILLDLGLRSQNSLHVVEIVKKEFPQAKVIVMDLAPAQGDVLQFVKAGASGFILKDATVDDFLATIRSVAGGQKVLPPVLNGSLFTQIIEHAVGGGKANINRAIRMTKREQEVIACISNGLTNKEIAGQLRIASYTIKSHVHNIMEKLALHTRLEIANYAYTDGTLTKEVAKSISMIDNN
ncbi:MAG TPA: response regulator transcription factor [Bacteroidota bacterium]|jgi:DNA-binding NarL/FixJ family response regulator|nr:response regulator transcription factor [Bacteroidota bacterium]